MSQKKINLSDLQKSIPSEKMSCILNDLGLKNHCVSSKHKKTLKKEKKGVRGRETAPIFNSLLTAQLQSDWNDDVLMINIEGGRILTYNELYAILQYRKYEAFKYKKICREIIHNALLLNSHKAKPFFDTPCKLTLIRISSKEMDLDSLPVVFKYFIDSLKREHIIVDDNPNIIAEIECLQSVGEHRLSLRLEKLHTWKKKTIPSWKDWSL